MKSYRIKVSRDSNIKYVFHMSEQLLNNGGRENQGFCKVSGLLKYLKNKR